MMRLFLAVISGFFLVPTLALGQDDPRSDVSVPTATPADAYIAALRELKAHPEWLKPGWNTQDPEPGIPGVFVERRLLACTRETAYRGTPNCPRDFQSIVQRDAVPTELMLALEEAVLLDCVDQCSVTPQLSRVALSLLLPIYEASDVQRLVELEVLVRANPSWTSSTGAHGRNVVQAAGPRWKSE